MRVLRWDGSAVVTPNRRLSTVEDVVAAMVTEDGVRRPTNERSPG